MRGPASCTESKGYGLDCRTLNKSRHHENLVTNLQMFVCCKPCAPDVEATWAVRWVFSHKQNSLLQAGLKPTPSATLAGRYTLHYQLCFIAKFVTNFTLRWTVGLARIVLLFSHKLVQKNVCYKRLRRNKNWLVKKWCKTTFARKITGKLDFLKDSESEFFLDLYKVGIVLTNRDTVCNLHKALQTKLAIIN